MSLIDIKQSPVSLVLKLLLQDKTTGKNIIWATDAYISYGACCSDKSQITAEILLGINAVKVQPRIEKALEEQQIRTRKKAEVFTPVWLCNKMNNYCDEEWFGRKDVFNVECSNNQWDVIDAKLKFPIENNKKLKKKDWKHYVDSRRLEITCGEAPYLVSRYDAATGNLIFPLFRRIGILDRKLRIVNENAATDDEWRKWSIRAIQSCYGYEYQGDSLLIARINVLITYVDYYRQRFGDIPDIKNLRKIANIISWNLWQMDGLKDTVPLGKPIDNYDSPSLFDIFPEEMGSEKIEETNVALPCKIFNWRSNESILFKTCKDQVIHAYRNEANHMTDKKKLFDYCIGNPPYQEEQNGRALPVYDVFMEEAFKVANVTEFVTPARFLFNAGQTNKDWNKKILSDEHFSVLDYSQNSSAYFSGVEIKGGWLLQSEIIKRNMEQLVFLYHHQ